MAEAYLFDLDGTLYAGGAAIPGASALLRELQTRGVPFRLVTNTTSRSRAMLVERLRGYGFEVAAEELFTAVLAGVELLRAAGHRSVAPFVPEPALEDMRGVDLVVSGDGRRADAVVIGDLGDGWDYALLQRAFEHLMNGAALVALSRDRYWLRDGRLVLDAGPFVAALEYATGVTAAVAGKPSAMFYAAAVRSLGFEGREHEVVMVGDDLWSDIEGAQRAGLRGWVVRTGKFREAVLAGSGVTPDRILTSVTDVV